MVKVNFQRSSLSHFVLKKQNNLKDVVQWMIHIQLNNLSVSEILYKGFKYMVNISKTCLYNTDPLKPHFYI